MYLNNLKKLRIKNNLTQEGIAKKINVNLYTYINWERNIVIVPLLKMDQLALYYNVSLSYILGINTNYEKLILKPASYEKILSNLSKLKLDNKHSYANLAIRLNCSRYTIIRYFTGKRNIPIDKLIELSELYKIDLDVLCGKK